MYSQEEFHNLFIELYNEKQKTITLEDVGKKMGICGETVRYHINKSNAYENCPDVFRNIQKPLRNFETIQEEAAYWLGYLMADGCLAPDGKGKKGFRLMLECKTEDREILEKFCEFLNIRKDRITSGHQGASVALSMSENNFTISPRIYGIVPNKSHVENHLPEIMKENEKLFFQYFKGLVDGDGTICTQYGAKGVMLVGNSKTLLEEIKTELTKYIPEPSSIWIMEKTKEQQQGKNATQSLFVLKVGTGLKNFSNLRYIYNQFYNDSKVILTRKQQTFKSIL